MSESGGDTSRLPDGAAGQAGHVHAAGAADGPRSTWRPRWSRYYGLRAAGASEYAALLSATVLSGLRVVYGVVKSRSLDPFAAYLLLTFGLSLAVGLATTDPKLILVGNTFVNGLGGLIFLGSCFVGTPLTQVVGERFRKTARTPPRPSTTPHRRRRTHILLSAMWGIGLLVEVAIRLVVIANLSVDVANGVNSAITLPVDRPAGAGHRRRRAPRGSRPPHQRR